METLTWKIEALDCVPNLGNREKVVAVIHWRLVASDGDATASVCGAQAIPLADDGPFTPYEQLSTEQVLEWLEVDMGGEAVDAAQERALAALAAAVTPPIVNLPLPWAS